MTEYEIARWCHEVNRAVQELCGEEVSPPWDDAPEWQRASAVDGVRSHLHDDLHPAESHQAWLDFKRADGWTWGPVKDATLKQHPCFVPYMELPPEQRLKDHLFGAIVAVLG